jgi:hypothetical protein
MSKLNHLNNLTKNMKDFVEDSMDLPTKKEIQQKLHELVEHPELRGIVANWAIKFIFDDRDAPIKDDLVWNYLKILAGADLMDSPSTYLHGVEDFISWLNDFETSINSKI